MHLIQIEFKDGKTASKGTTPSVRCTMHTESSMKFSYFIKRKNEEGFFFIQTEFIVCSTNGYSHSTSFLFFYDSLHFWIPVFFSSHFPQKCAYRFFSMLQTWGAQNGKLEMKLELWYDTVIVMVFTRLILILLSAKVFILMNETKSKDGGIYYSLTNRRFSHPVIIDFSIDKK